MNRRPERVSSLIEKELGIILLREVEIAGAVVTITGVDVSKKLENALIRVSVYPSGKAGEALTRLNAGTRRLQHLLFERINIRPMPQIKFEIDHGGENAARVEKLLMGDNNTSA